jgi:hypothetical protein
LSSPHDLQAEMANEISCRSQNRNGSALTPDADATCESACRRSAFSAKNSPNLATVIDAWASLPEAIRAGILAMVKAAKA